jgi:hypothetical protein
LLSNIGGRRAWTNPLDFTWLKDDPPLEAGGAKEGSSDRALRLSFLWTSIISMVS